MVIGGDFRQVLLIISTGSWQDIKEWTLKVGDGEIGEHYDIEVSIDLREEILLDAADDPVTSIVDSTYLKILDNINDPSYFREKAILSPTNEVMDNMNEHLL
ncbi:ATP-dependent DNA helicase PIF1-like protein [Tanacetum coccineum]